MEIKWELIAGIWQTEEDMWYQTWKRYLAEEDGLEQGTLLQALAYSQEPWTLSKLMDFAKNESQIKRQNYFHVYSYMASNPVGSPIIWNYYRYPTHPRPLKRTWQ